MILAQSPNQEPQAEAPDYLFVLSDFLNRIFGLVQKDFYPCVEEPV